MFESMYAAKGVGLAAPQIGISRRISVIDISVGEGPLPESLSSSIRRSSRREGKQVTEEGCLSVPGFREPVRRSMKVTVRAQNVKGETVRNHRRGIAGPCARTRNRPPQRQALHQPPQRSEARLDPPQGPQTSESRGVGNRAGRRSSYATGIPGHASVRRSHSGARSGGRA